MTKIEAIIQSIKIDAVKDALHALGAEGLTVTEVRGHGRQKGHTEVYRGAEYSTNLLPKLKVEVIVPEKMAERTIEAIVTAARTGKIGDGKVFVSTINEVIRIRDGEKGELAL